MVEIDHSLGGVMEIVDSMVDNNAIDPIVPTVNKVTIGGIGVVRVSWDDFTCVVGENSWTISAGSVDLNSSDVSSPTVYYVYFLGKPSNNYYPDVVVSNSDPSFGPNLNFLIISIIQMKSVSGTSTIYQAKFPNWSGTEDLVHNIVDDMIYTAPQWIDGIAPKLTKATGALDSSEGYIRFKSNATIHHDEVAAGKILCDDFTIHDTLMSILTYTDGTTIGANKFVKLTVARNVDQAGIIDAPFYVVRQGKPTTEYATESDAYNDAENKSASGFGTSSSSVVAIAYVTAQMNSSRTALDFSSGKLYDIRSYGEFGGGSSGGGGGGGTNDHHMLLNLTSYDDHTQYLRTDGTSQLTGDWDFGSNDIYGTGAISGQIIYGDIIVSNEDTLAPMEINSNAKVDNLNADLLDGYDATAFAPTANGVTNGNSHDHVGGDGAQIDHGGLAGLNDDDHTQYLKADGTRQLTGDWNTGAYEIISGSGITASWVTSDLFESTTPDGLPPMSVVSTTKVDNLNADTLDGYHASDLISGGGTDFLRKDGTTQLTGHWTTGAYNIINTGTISTNKAVVNAATVVQAGVDYVGASVGAITASGSSGNVIGLKVGANSNTATTSPTYGVYIDTQTSTSYRNCIGLNIGGISGAYHSYGIRLGPCTTSNGNISGLSVDGITSNNGYSNSNASVIDFGRVTNTVGAHAQFIWGDNVTSGSGYAHFLRMDSSNISATTGLLAGGLQFNDIYTSNASSSATAYLLKTNQVYATYGTAMGLNIASIHTDTTGGSAYGIKVDNISAANSSNIYGLKFGTLTNVGESGLSTVRGLQIDSLTNTGTFGYQYGINIDQLKSTQYGPYNIGFRMASTGSAGVVYGNLNDISYATANTYGILNSISNCSGSIYALKNSIYSPSGTLIRGVQTEIWRPSKDTIGEYISILSPTGTEPDTGISVSITNANGGVATGIKMDIAAIGSQVVYGDYKYLQHPSGTGAIVGSNIQLISNNANTASTTAGYKITSGVNQSSLAMNGFEVTSLSNTNSSGILNGFDIESVSVTDSGSGDARGLNIENVHSTHKAFGIRINNVSTTSTSTTDFALGGYYTVGTTTAAPAYGNVVTLFNTSAAASNCAGYVFYGTNSSTLGMAGYSIYTFGSSTGQIAGYQIYDMEQSGNENLYGFYGKTMHSVGNGKVIGINLEEVSSSGSGKAYGIYMDTIGHMNTTNDRYGICISAMPAGTSGSGYGFNIDSMYGNNVYGFRIGSITPSASSGTSYFQCFGTLIANVNQSVVGTYYSQIATTSGGSAYGLWADVIRTNGGSGSAYGINLPLVTTMTGTGSTYGAYFGNIYGNNSGQTHGVYVNTVTYGTATSGFHVESVANASAGTATGVYVGSVSGNNTNMAKGYYLYAIYGGNAGGAGIHIENVTNASSTGGAAYGIKIDSISGNSTGTTYGLYIGNAYAGANNYAINAQAGRVVFKGLAGSGIATQMRYDTTSGEVFYQTSTRTLKENIVYEVDSDWIYNLRPCTYDRKDGSTHNEIGLIAEDVSENTPEDVSRNITCKNADGKIVSYDKDYLIVPMLAELQKLNARIAELENRLAQ